MKLAHPELVTLLQKAYSGEMAAAFAYVGHAGSLKCPVAKKAVKQIEDDEWGHRANILALMRQYEVPVSRAYELRFYLIGKVISLSCYVIGWFMPYFFAGKLESGNVCEYFVMMRYFQSLGIHAHDEILYEMGIKQKEHEVYFLEQIQNSKLLPVFQKLFGWGPSVSANDVDLARKYPVGESRGYCKNYKAGPEIVSRGDAEQIGRLLKNVTGPFARGDRSGPRPEFCRLRVSAPPREPMLKDVRAGRPARAA